MILKKKMCPKLLAANNIFKKYELQIKKISIKYQKKVSIERY